MLWSLVTFLFFLAFVSWIYLPRIFLFSFASLNLWILVCCNIREIPNYLPQVNHLTFLGIRISGICMIDFSSVPVQETKQIRQYFPLVFMIWYFFQVYFSSWKKKRSSLKAIFLVVTRTNKSYRLYLFGSEVIWCTCIEHSDTDSIILSK